MNTEALNYPTDSGKPLYDLELFLQIALKLRVLIYLCSLAYDLDCFGTFSVLANYVHLTLVDLILSSLIVKTGECNGIQTNISVLLLTSSDL